MKTVMLALVFGLILMLPVRAPACSLASCLGDGVELRSDFSVHVTIDGKPLPGVTVDVTYFGGGKTGDAFSARTDSHGIARIKLPAGAYWLHTDLLGISAGGQCFHISQHTSWKAKRSITYEWAELVPTTRQLAGGLVDSQPGQGGNPLWNITHRVNVPIAGAKLKLQSPLTGKVLTAISDDGGTFAFDSAPEGIYVLHVDNGIAPDDRDYDSADLQIRLSHTSARNSLLLKHQEAGGGFCGGTHLELQSASN